ncbi:kinase activator [Zalerion maritima]|uniref:Autophagy-related protein 17 n=1 Tax=Zalerion maritima TaxID=339359 RepID=A0AAD5WR11_9PEZI|nr:kinase activator [Zalerion maritima]
MAASPAPRSSGSLGSSTSAHSYKGSHRTSGYASEDSVPVETLVEHLLAAKRSLSSISLVLRADEITQDARRALETTVVLNAQSEFLRRGILDQARLLLRVRKGLARTYDTAKKDFGEIVRDMDAADGKLNATMNVLRGTIIESAFRPQGEEPKNLMDFVDEKSVHGMRESLKESIGELQAIQQSFDSDLLRFENDLRSLTKTLSPPSTSPSDSNSTQQSTPYLLESLIEHSHGMAKLLNSLTQHFDLCVTAVRTTEGGAELARLKAAETTASHYSSSVNAESVSISGVIAQQEGQPEVDPLSASDRANMLAVVASDSEEVGDVVAELNERLEAMESEYAILVSQAEQSKTTNMLFLSAYRILEEVGSRLGSYVQAEIEFIDRWDNERSAIGDKLQEMERLRNIYESYSEAYDSLILEAERRRAVNEKIQNIWRKAKESVDKLVDSDMREREMFKQDVGDHLPTDLWPGMGGPVRRWTIVPKAEAVEAERPADCGSGSLSALERSVVQGARERLSRRSAGRV